MSKVSHIIVNLGEQQLYCLDDHENIVRAYPVSTSSQGCGSQDGSFKTPLGKHSIAQKIGHGCVINEVFVGRLPQGSIGEWLAANKTLPTDIITSRILWLQGLEPGINQGDGIDSLALYLYTWYQ